MADRLVVTAAVVEENGRFLVTRRPDDVHLAGYWEFPGGKCEPGEDHEACLRREMREELDVDIRVGEKVLEVSHDYPGRSVELHFYRCSLSGSPVARLGQEMRWASRDELGTLPFPEADADLIAVLIKASGAAGPAANRPAS